MVKRNKSQDEGDENDDDLKDLLSDDKMSTRSSNKNNNSNGTETEHMNLDHLVQGKLDLTTSPSNDSNRSSPHQRGNGATRAYSFNKSSSSSSSGGIRSVLPLQFIWHMIRTIINYIAMLCHFHPGFCSIILFISIGITLYCLACAVFNPKRAYGVLKHDHSDIKSVYDLSVGKIDHWCLRGDNDSCHCEDPLSPTSRAEFKSWQLAFKTNRKIVKALEESQASVDVAFLGESIVEEMDGRWLGRQRKTDLGIMEQTFQSNFNKAKGASVNGVALGIAGDTSPNVLWRLMHGEMSNTFNPKVWWVTLGMNDIGRMQCSEEVVVLGILRVVEEIINTKPDAHIVINSLFPMTYLRGDMYPYLHDYKDSLGATARSDQQVERAEKYDNGGWIRDGKRKTTDPRYATPLAPPVGAVRPAGGQKAQRVAARPAQREGDAYRLGFQNRRLGGHRDLRLRKREETHEKILTTRARAQTQPKMSTVEEQEGEDADAEEEVREQLAAHHKKHLLQPRKRTNDQVNTPVYYQKKRPLVAKRESAEPLLVEQHQIRKRTKDTKLPLWTSIVVVNDQLKKFAQHNANRVTFFDATPLFTSATTSEFRRRPEYHLRTDLITERGHPTPLGFRIWEGAVLQKLQPILEQYNRDHPAAVVVPAPAPPSATNPAAYSGTNTQQDMNYNNNGQLFNPAFLNDDESADNLNGLHLDYDAMAKQTDDSFEDDAFHQHNVDDNYDENNEFEGPGQEQYKNNNVNDDE